MDWSGVNSTSQGGQPFDGWPVIEDSVPTTKDRLASWGTINSTSCVPCEDAV